MTDAVRLIRADASDAQEIWQMQKVAFYDLWLRYRDDATSPACEPADKTRMRLAQPFTYYYRIVVGDCTVGAIRVVDRKSSEESKRISPIFILPAFRNRGYASAAIREAERIHGAHGWLLDTILQEAGNCRLYEKCGYRRTQDTVVVNSRMTLVYYTK